MRAAELKALLERQPFVPLRLLMTDGRTLDIRHPELIWVLTQRIDVAVDPDPDTGVLQRVDHYSLIHLIRVEELGQGQPTDGQQQQST